MSIAVAIRSWSRASSAPLLAVAVLSATLASATVVFSIVDATAIRALPFEAPKRLVAVEGLPSTAAGLPSLLTPRDFFAWLDGTAVFSSLGAASTVEHREYADRDRRHRLSVRLVTANLFSVLGVPPHRGRLFSLADETPGSHPTVVLSYDTWTQRFGADPGVINSVVRDDDGRNALVLGVLPPRVAFPIGLSEADAYAPLVVTTSLRESVNGFVRVVGRLKEGASLRDAQEDVSRVSAALVVPLHEHVVGPARPFLLLTLGAAALLMLVACVNVALLLLARAIVRRADTATRHALGASRRRLAWDLVVQGLILVVPSAVGAWLVSIWSLSYFVALLPPEITRTADIAFNVRVFITLVIVSGGCVLIASSLPAVSITRLNLSRLIQAGSKPIVGGTQRILLAAVAASIALVFALSVASLSVVTTFINIASTDMGFDRSNIVSIWFAKRFDQVPPEQRTVVVQEFRRSVLAKVRGVDGVRAAALSNMGAPLSGARAGARMTVPGYGTTKGFEIESRRVTRDYFSLLGMTRLSGRLFDDTDSYGSPRVMVINDIAARRLFGDRSPVGAVVDFNGPVTIIGVVAAANSNGPEVPAAPEVVQLADQESFERWPIIGGAVLVKTSERSEAVAHRVRESIAGLLGPPPLGQPSGRETHFIEDYFVQKTAIRRLQATAMGAFGFVSLMIAAAGVYGTVSFSTAQQSRAIALQLALGASPRQVRNRLLRQCSLALVVGLSIGTIISLLLSKVLSGVIVGVATAGAGTYVGVAVGLAAIVVLGGSGPARRASNADPTQVLRWD